MHWNFGQEQNSIYAYQIKQTFAQHAPDYNHKMHNLSTIHGCNPQDFARTAKKAKHKTLSHWECKKLAYVKKSLVESTACISGYLNVGYL